MRILENIKTKKISRKSFVFYSGLVTMGAYALIKIPFKIFGGKEKVVDENKHTEEYMFRSNPGSVKRG